MKTTLAILLSLWTCAAFAATNTFVAPFYVYKDYLDRQNHGTPSGWMGDYRDLTLDMNCTNNPHSGKTCIKFTYSAKGSKYADMAGVMWQSPANNTGDIDGGVNLTGATQLTFWARGEKGREYIEAFTLGGIVGPYPDSDKTSITAVTLKKEWRQYTIDLSKCDLMYISSFFGWIAARFANRDGFTIYIDDIRID